MHILFFLSLDCSFLFARDCCVISFQWIWIQIPFFLCNLFWIEIVNGKKILEKSKKGNQKGDSLIAKMPISTLISDIKEKNLWKLAQLIPCRYLTIHFYSSSFALFLCHFFLFSCSIKAIDKSARRGGFISMHYECSFSVKKLRNLSLKCYSTAKSLKCNSMNEEFSFFYLSVTIAVGSLHFFFAQKLRYLSTDVRKIYEKKCNNNTQKKRE